MEKFKLNNETQKKYLQSSKARDPVIRIRSKTYDSLIKYCKENDATIVDVATQAIDYALRNTEGASVQKVRVIAHRKALDR